VTLLKKVQPYHSVQARRRGGVYHDRADCPDGQRLYSDHLVAGRSGLPHCDHCRALNEQAQRASESEAPG
jgi:hypothetical protein